MSRILQICSEFGNRPLYSHLVEKLSEKVSHQTIYVPVRQRSHMDRHRIDSSNNIDFHYSLILNPMLRLAYFAKARKITNDIVRKIDVASHDLIHAHTLFTNGGPALKLKRRFGIPFVVAVRNTDLSIFFRYFPHARSFGLQVLEEARAIILIAPSWKEKLRTVVPAGKWPDIEPKCVAIPNAVDDSWQENRIEYKDPPRSDHVRVLYVGSFIKRKGVQHLIRALDVLNDAEPRFHLTLVGGGGGYEPRIRQMAEKREYVSFKSQLPQHELLLEYRDADMFAMPSHSETFGLVYIEAMTQGLPILYSRGEGIDMLFRDGEVGYAACHDSPNDIAVKLQMIESQHEKLSHNAFIKSKDFTWDAVSHSYVKLYSTASKSSQHDSHE
jgi:glycosyltransferase involved in cell wall biosynthesis